MFGWLKSIFLSHNQVPVSLVPEVLGLRLGGAFEFDELYLRLIEPDLIIEKAATIQIIQAVGEVKLDNQNRLLRFYTDDDGFIQVLQHGTTDADISEVRMFYFCSSKPVDTNSQWESLLSHGLVQETWTIEDYTFTKVWENDLPVAMTENTWYKDGSQDQTDQFTMIYERKVNDERFEGLMVSAEEKIVSNGVERSLITCTSFELSSTNFNVIG